MAGRAATEIASRTPRKRGSRMGRGGTGETQRRGQTAHPGSGGTAGTGVEQAYNPEVAGSNPAPATTARPQVRALLGPRGGALSRAGIEMLRPFCGLVASIPASDAVSSRSTQRSGCWPVSRHPRCEGEGFSLRPANIGDSCADRGGGPIARDLLTRAVPSVIVALSFCIMNWSSHT
jgi:hypothetical protein